MPGFRDAEELDRDTDRFMAERQAQADAAERQRQEKERTSREADAKTGRDNSLWAVQSNARNIAGFEEQLAWLRAQLRNWKERNRGFVNVTATEVALFVLLMTSPFAVATLDYLMLSYVGREIARGAVESFKGVGADSMGRIVFLAVVLFTLGYVVVELVIGAARDNDRLSRELRRHAGQLAVMLWITLPLFIVTFSLVASGMFSADPAKTMGRATLTAAIFRAALFGVFAMAIHGFILRFGSAVVNSYGYGLYRTRRLYIERRIRNLEGRRRAAGGDLESGFRDLHGAVTDEGGRAQVKVGPFAATTVRVTNAEFGATVIETPEMNESPRPSTTNGAGPRQPDPDHNDNGRRAGAEAAADDPNAHEPSEARQNRSETADEWPGTVYDMSDEDEVR